MDMKVVLYCRIATKAQGDDVIMNAQLEQLRMQAELNDLEVIGEVTAYEKGVTLERPGWCEALCLAAEKQADGILVTSPDRVARDTALFMGAQAELKARGLELITCDGTMPF